MTKGKPKGGLGRGLDALIPNMGDLLDEVIPAESDAAASADGVQQVPRERIDPNPYQPRRHFDPEALAELAESIRKQGIFTPLIVVPQRDDRYTLVSGERRLRAAALAELDEVPVLVKDYDARTMAELALMENLQREDLSAYEEALAYQALIDAHGQSAADIATALGKSRPHIANTLRLLNLSEPVLALLADGSLSAGHARALLRIEDPALQLELAETAIANGQSVRALEHLISEILAPLPDERQTPPTRRADSPYRPLGEQLSERLQTKVSFGGGRRKGQLRIDFYGEEDLKRILDLLGVELY